MTSKTEDRFSGNAIINYKSVELFYLRNTRFENLPAHRPLQKRERAGKEYGCFPFV